MSGTHSMPLTPGQSPVMGVPSSRGVSTAATSSWEWKTWSTATAAGSPSAATMAMHSRGGPAAAAAAATRVPFPVSAKSGEGHEPLRAELCSGTSALIGPSGVGKSSLLNALDPGLALRTGELSAKTRTGRHTTVSSRLLELGCGGLVADTPGFGDVAIWGVAAEELAGCFPELSRAEPCRFRGCAHMQEPDCGVREAVEAGRIPEARYRSYRKLYEEAAERTEY